MIAPFFLSLVLLMALPCGSGVFKRKKQCEKKQLLQIKEAKPKKGLLHFKGHAESADRSSHSEANQGMCKQNPFESQVRTCKVYRQFATLATFDAVQLDDDLARRLADKKREMRCLTQVAHDQQLMDQLDELSSKHVIYVLADVRAENYDKLTDQNAEWCLLLKELSGTQPLAAQKITEIDLDAETRLLFGEEWREISAFKTLYKFEFPRALLQPNESACSLVVSSPQVSDEIVWQV